MVVGHYGHLVGFVLVVGHCCCGSYCPTLPTLLWFDWISTFWTCRHAPRQWNNSSSFSFIRSVVWCIVLCAGIFTFLFLLPGWIYLLVLRVQRGLLSTMQLLPGLRKASLPVFIPTLAPSIFWQEKKAWLKRKLLCLWHGQVGRLGITLPCSSVQKNFCATFTCPKACLPSARKSMPEPYP